MTLQVFMTGGSGIVGSATLRSLQRDAAGQFNIRALARSDASAQKVEKLGATPVMGTTSDLDLLAKEAEAADVVLYCAFDAGGAEWDNQADLEYNAMETCCRALSTTTSTRLGGKKKLMMFCGGVMSFPSSPVSDEQVRTPPHPRVKTDDLVRSYATSPPEGKGIRAIQLRLAMLTHHPSHTHEFAQWLHQGDHIAYYKDGNQKWPAVDAADVGDLIAGVLQQQEKVPEGKFNAVHGFGEYVTPKEIAKVMAENSGLPVGQLSDQEYKDMDPFRQSILATSPALSNEWTKKTFGWKPHGQTLFDCMREGGWFKEGQGKGGAK